MGDNVAAYRLLGLDSATEACIIDLGHDLVRYHDSHAKLVRKAHQRAQELGQVSLARRQLATTRKVCAVERRQ